MGTKKNMSKTLNRVQADTLLNRMLKNPDIAKGFVRESREKVSAFWKELSLDLNIIGPPEKGESEWKKVWIDQKRYVRKKAAANMQQQGEPRAARTGRRMQKFTPSEEVIFQLIGPKEAVEGAQSCGLLPPAVERPKTNSENEVVVVPSTGEYLEEVLECSDSGDAVPLGPSSNEAAWWCSSDDVPRRRKQNTSEVVKELETQPDLCAKVGVAIANMKDHKKEMQCNAKNIYRSLDRMQELKTLQLQEMKRHHLQMEKLKAEEIEESTFILVKLIERPKSCQTKEG